VRKLRNDFAHEKQGVSFQEPKYRQRFQAIHTSCEEDYAADEAAKTLEEPVEEDAKPVRHLGMTKGQLFDRLTFCIAVAGMIGRIKSRRAMAEVLVQRSLSLADTFDKENVG